MSNDKILHVTDADFDEKVLKASGLVLVDFWAEWCGPCKMIAPVLDAAADTYSDQLRIAKVNIEMSPVTPGTYEVRSIPTLMLFKNGEQVGVKLGNLNKSQLAAFIDAHL